jgi:hypothetical protein
MKRTLILMVSTCSMAFGQMVDTRPEFDVASLKLSAPDSRSSRMAGGPGTPEPERWSATKVDLFNALLMAYDLKAYQLVAPSWQRNGYIDIVAKAFLSGQVGRPVIDATGLTGWYGLTLSFAVDTRMDGGLGSPSSSGIEPTPLPAAPYGPTIFKAVQDQLGLKLEAKKGLIDVLVIDHMDKVPTEN